MRSGGTFSKISIRITTNTVSTTSTLKFRKNTANGTQTVNIAASTTGDFTDTSGTDTVADGDLVCFQLDIGPGGSGALFTASYSVLFTATSGAMYWLCWSNAHDATFNNSTQYSGWTTCAYNGTELVSRTQIPVAGTAQKLYFVVASNARSTTSTIRSRKNGANGNLVQTFAGGATGIFEDTSNSDTLAVDDEYCFALTTGTGSGTIGGTKAKIEFIPTTETDSLTTLVGNSGGGLSAGSTNYFFSGNAAATEANCRVLTNQGFIASKLWTYISANSTTASSTVASRKNSAAGAQLLTIGAAATGEFTDASNSDTYISTDYMSIQAIVGTGGTMAIKNTSWKYDTAPPPVGANFDDWGQFGTFGI
jgi:hypothetical protein